MNPYVFIVGCPRSGTTLLRRMVDAHPQIAITPETHWIPRYFRKRVGINAEGFVTPDLINKLMEYERFSQLNINRDDLEGLVGGEKELLYATFVSRIFDLYGKAQGKLLAGDKTPAYVQNLNLLHQLWPETKFVHIIRDGRDVCLSVRNWSRWKKSSVRFSTWVEDPVSTVAVWWKRLVRLGREEGAVLGPKLYYELRYESLVADPEKECGSLCAFLEVAYDDSMVRFHEGRTKQDPGLSAKRAWLPVTPGLRDWKKEMSSLEIERFEAAAGELLDKLGYPRFFSNPSSENLQHAARIQQLFTTDIKARGLPKQWESAKCL